MPAWARWVAVLVGALVVTAGTVVVAVRIWEAVADRAVATEQERLDPFYTAPALLPGPPGTLIRTEPLALSITGGRALRMLYVSERADGEPTVRGGMVFVPSAPAPTGGRPVVAWAHGTIGMGDACAPSRASDPLLDTQGWLEQMLALGWVVTATDYAGLGTAGAQRYLVGQSEARDVVNSVRAVRTIPDAQPGDRFAVWGHSQGGHAALWTGQLSGELAADLTLVGVAAAAPAARLVDIIGAQWRTLIAWVIGPEVAIGWPATDPSLRPAAILTRSGLRSYERVAADCITSVDLKVDVGLRRLAGEQFFAVNPLTMPAWLAFATEQTPAPLTDVPVFIGQGTADEVVLAWPNAALQEQWCAAGVDLTMLWLGGVGHMSAANAAGPSAVAWLADRFAGRPAVRTCDVPPPVAQPGGGAGTRG